MCARHDIEIGSVFNQARRFQALKQGDDRVLQFQLGDSKADAAVRASAETEMARIALRSMSKVSARSNWPAFAEENTTFSAFVLSTRLDRAKAALLSDNFASFSITDIAHWFGFFDASHLNRHFRKKFGDSPSSFRVGED